MKSPMYKFKKYISSTIQTNPRWQPSFWSFASFIRSFMWWERDKFVLDDSGKFLFIVGCGRSGNTLLRRLLMEKYNIFIPPETYVLASQIRDYTAGKSRNWPQQVESVLSKLEYHPEFETFGIDSLSPFALEVKNWSKDKRSFQSLIINLYKWMASTHGRSVEWVGDKTPINTLNLGYIHKAFPSAKFVFIERDPVDVVASYLEAGIYSSPVDAAQRWVNSYKAWKNFVKLKCSTDIMAIRYEDLVRDSFSCVADISSQFGIPVDDNEKGCANDNAAILGDVGKRTHHSNVVNAPNTSSIGKGRLNLKGDELKHVRDVVGNLAEERGYEKI
jgi:protein-tyrosine sulfotransferase